MPKVPVAHLDSGSRTRIVEAAAELSLHDLIAEEEQVFTLTVNGTIKRSSMDEFRDQRRGGVGLRVFRTRGEDTVREIFMGNTHSQLLVFTTQGQVYGVPVHQIPETNRDASGTAIVNLVPRSRCAEGDELFAVCLARTEQHVLITTRDGIAIRFPGLNEEGELEVRHMGRVARGVRGITLGEGDEIARLVLENDPSLEILTVTENGYGKRTLLEKYRTQGRGGRGVINIDANERNGRVVGSLQVHESDSVMLITDTGRVIKIRVEENERVVSIARVVDTEDDTEAVTPPVEVAEGEEAVSGMDTLHQSARGGGRPVAGDLSHWSHLRSGLSRISPRRNAEKRGGRSAPAVRWGVENRRPIMQRARP